MAQQIFDKHWPLGKNGANELIPGAAILQTRDGKDEPITLAASFQIGESGLFLPTSKDNPLEVRVRQLEAELQQLRQLLQNGDARVTLTGRIVETIVPRGVYSETINVTLTIPDGVRGASVTGRVYGATGKFEVGEGFRLRTRLDVFDRPIWVMNSDFSPSGNRFFSHLYYPGATPGDAEPEHNTNRSNLVSQIPPALFHRLNVYLEITGTFEPGEGFDLAAQVRWLY